MLHAKLTIIKSIVAFIFCLSSITLVFPQYVEFTQITDDEPPQSHPAFYGDYIVFESDVTPDNPDLLLYRISTGTTTTIVSDPGSSSSHPDIYENMVVWQDNRGGNWEIYYYIIGASAVGGEPLLVWEGDQVEPSIYGDNIVFSDKKPGVTSWNIQWLQYTPGILQRLTDDTDGDQRDPDIYDQVIVWEDARMGNFDIYMYSIAASEYRVITDDPADQVNPSVHKYRIVWEDYRDGDANIYMEHLWFGLGTVFEGYDWPVVAGNDPSKHDPYSQTKPHIYEDNLVFMDYRNGNWDIYLYKYFNPIAGNLHRITTESQDQKYPVAYDKYVVWQDERSWDGSDPYKSDIWMWEYPPGADIMVVIQDEPDPVETNSELLYTLYVWNSGPEDAENAIMTATLDDRVDHISTINLSGEEGCSRVGNTITCDLGNMPSGTLDTIQIRVRPTTEAEITIMANVQSDQKDLLPSNNTFVAKTDVLWQVYSEIGRGATPSFKLDQNNRVHVVYLSDYMEGDLLYATNAQGGWIKETLDEDAYGCMLDIDKEGNIHIVYSKMNNSGQYFLMHRGKTESGWMDAEEIDSNFMGFNNLDLAVSPAGIIYVSFLENRWNDPIQLAYKKDGTWHGPSPLAVSAYNDQAMEVDGNGHLHFAYYAIAGNPAGPQYYTNAPDSIWKDQVGIEPAWGGGQLETLNLDLDLDNQGNPHVSYSGQYNGDYEENHRYAVLSGGNWDYEYIEDEHWSVFNTVATDANQKAHLLYYRTDGNRLRYTDNTSGSWDYKTIDFGTEEICDNEIDKLGYIHIIYSSNLNLRYVTNAPPAPEPEMKLTPDVIDFVMRAVGDTTDTRKAVIENTGDADLIISEVKLVWPDYESFSIAGSTCDVVNPGDSCSIDVAFNPTSLGDKVALLWVECNDPGDNTQAVRLEGLGLEPIYWDYGNTVFEDVYLGDSAINNYKILNKGNTNLHIQAVYIQEDDAGDFYYADLPDTPFTIEEGDSVEFKLIFKPNSLGEKTTKFRIYTNDNDYLRILVGTCKEPMLTLEGSIETGDGTIVDKGRIIVAEYDEDGASIMGYSKPLDGVRDYQFINLNKNYYMLRFDPDRESFPSYLNTYLGNTPFYDEAIRFLLEKDTSGLVIELVPVPPPPEGDGEISGNLVDEEGSGGGRIEYGRYAGTGTPVEDAAVYLLNTDGEIIDYDYTDASGFFEFQNIPAGSYSFYADYEGYPMDPANETLVLDENIKTLEIVAVVENDIISAKLASTTGLLTFSEAGFRAYPNPVNDQLTIYLPESIDNAAIKIFFINSIGQKWLVPESLNNRSVKQLSLNASLSKMPDGLFIVVIESKCKGYYTKIVKTSK